MNPGPDFARNERLAMLAALVNGDVSLAYRLAIQMLAGGVPFDVVVGDVLAPVQSELGSRWAAGDLGIADEHAASAAVEALVVRLSATDPDPGRPTVVVATPDSDAHALGGRVVASALALDGFRVVFLGASLPASDLGEYLDLHAPLALALSCSVAFSLPDAARSIAAAHESGVPVVIGGRAIPGVERAHRLGADAYAGSPGGAVARTQEWEAARPTSLRPAAPPVPEGALLANNGMRLAVAAADAVSLDRKADLADEIHRLLRVIEAALLLDDPAILREQVRWLRTTGPLHGVPLDALDRALTALVGALDGELARAGAALQDAIT